MTYQHTFLKGLFNDSQDNPELNGNLLSPTDINILGRRFTSRETAHVSIWDQLEPSFSMPPANLGSHEQIKPGSGSAPISSTNNGASGPSIRESVSEANNWFSFVSEYAGLFDSHGNEGVPPSQVFDFNDLHPNSFSNAEPVGISNQVLEPGLSEGQHNRGLLQRTHVSLDESPSRTFENSFSVIDFFTKDDGGRQRVKLGDTNSSHKRKNVVVCGESSPVISYTTFNDGTNNTKEDINTRSTTARIVACEDWSLVSSVGNEEGSKRNARRKITHADQATTSTPNLYLEEDSFALYNPWPVVEISFMDAPSNPAVQSRLTGRNATPNKQHLVRAIPGPTLDLYPPFQILGSSTSEVGSSLRSPMPSIDEATEELNLVSGTLDQEAVHESSLNLTGSVHRDGSTSFDLHHDHLSTLVENVHHQSGPVNCHYPSPFPITLNMLPKQNGGVSGVPLSTWSHAAARREGRSRILEVENETSRLGPLDFELVLDRARNSNDRYQDMRMDIDNMSYEELLALGERIGNVNTGLSQEKILSGLRQRKYIPSLLELSEDAEQCSICQEEYIEGEELGRLNCGHDFHTICIKQWLGIKNWCPICKNTGLQGA